MFTSIGKFFISVAIGVSALLGIHHAPAQPAATPATDQVVNEAVVSTSSSQKAIPAIQTTKSSSIFQKIEALVAPSKNETPAPAPIAESQKPVTIPNSVGKDCTPTLTVTPATLTPTVPQTDTFTIKMVDLCGFQNVYLRMGTGSSSVDYAIPSSSIDSSGTVANFTRDIAVDSSQVGRWVIYMAAAWPNGIRTQTIRLQVAEDPAKLAAEAAKKAAEEARAVHVTLSPSTIAYGATTTLSWIDSQASSCTLGSSPVLLAKAGSEVVSPTISDWSAGGSVTYTVTCNLDTGSVSGSGKVMVRPWQPPEGFKVLPGGQCTEATAPCTTGPNGWFCSRQPGDRFASCGG